MTEDEFVVLVLRIKQSIERLATFANNNEMDEKMKNTLVERELKILRRHRVSLDQYASTSPVAKKQVMQLQEEIQLAAWLGNAHD